MRGSRNADNINKISCSFVLLTKDESKPNTRQHLMSDEGSVFGARMQLNALALPVTEKILLLGVIGPLFISNSRPGILRRLPIQSYCHAWF